MAKKVKTKVTKKPKNMRQKLASLPKKGLKQKQKQTVNVNVKIDQSKKTVNRAKNNSEKIPSYPNIINTYPVFQTNHSNLPPTYDNKEKIDEKFIDQNVTVNDMKSKITDQKKVTISDDKLTDSDNYKSTFETITPKGKRKSRKLPFTSPTRMSPIFEDSDYSTYGTAAENIIPENKNLVLNKKSGRRIDNSKKGYSDKIKAGWIFDENTNSISPPNNV